MERYVLMLKTDADDKYLTESTLAEIGNDVEVKFISDIDELHELSVSRGEPSLILLNDHGATHSSNTALRTLKQHPSYGHIPVVVLGEVSAPEYIRECYLAGANTFITKPSSMAETRKKIETFFNYWFNVAEV